MADIGLNDGAYEGKKISRADLMRELEEQADDSSPDQSGQSGQSGEDSIGEEGEDGMSESSSASVEYENPLKPRGESDNESDEEMQRN